MSFINHMTREINLKIVYQGPTLSGKRTNLQYIDNKTQPEIRGRPDRFAPENEGTLFFDFSPSSLGTHDGFRFRFHLYTVQGSIVDDASHRLVLKGVDGVVFVADSQQGRAEANLESLDRLINILEAQGNNLAQVPIVLQYNKRDLSTAMPVEDLDALLRAPWSLEWSRFEAVANKGIGVFETLKELARQMILLLRWSAK